MAEQERRIADQERNLANSERAQSARDRDPPEARGMQEMPPPTMQPASNLPERERPPDEERKQDMPPPTMQPASNLPERERPPDEERKQDMPPQPDHPASREPERESPPEEVDVEVEVTGMEQQEPSKRPTGRIPTQEPEDSQVEEPSWQGRPSGADPMRERENEEVEPVHAGRSTGRDKREQRVQPDDESDGLERDISLAPAPGQREELPVYYDEDEQPDNPPPRRRRQEQDWDAARDSDRPSSRPAKPAARRQQARSENEHNSHGDDNGNRPLNRNGTGSRVYDEYFQLLSETEESSEESDEASPAAPMDINLVASLVRWASIAKQRVGEDRLHDILELYLQSGHATPGLREMLTHISGMADAMPPETNQTAQECVDLISHLHGILTGALAIVRVPQVKIPV